MVLLKRTKLTIIHTILDRVIFKGCRIQEEHVIAIMVVIARRSLRPTKQSPGSLKTRSSRHLRCLAMTDMTILRKFQTEAYLYNKRHSGLSGIKTPDKRE